jgi:hypothetical protein
MLHAGKDPEKEPIQMVGTVWSELRGQFSLWPELIRNWLVRSANVFKRSWNVYQLTGLVLQMVYNRPPRVDGACVMLLWIRRRGVTLWYDVINQRPIILRRWKGQQVEQSSFNISSHNKLSRNVTAVTFAQGRLRQHLHGGYIQCVFWMRRIKKNAPTTPHPNVAT